MHTYCGALASGLVPPLAARPPSTSDISDSKCDMTRSTCDMTRSTCDMTRSKCGTSPLGFVRRQAKLQKGTVVSVSRLSSLFVGKRC